MMLKRLLSFRFRRQLLIGVALFALVGCTGNTTPGQPRADSAPQLPQQTLLSSSMRQQPVPGWTVTVEQLGLPPDSGVTPLTNIGARAIFLGITDDDWWVVGLDVTTGRRFLDPVRVGPADADADVDCYVNGPPMVMCVWHGPDPDAPSAAWVLDTEAGKVAFEGSAEVRVAASQGQPLLEQMADYAVATVAGEGIYGVGSRGELTWFVPGNGVLSAQFAMRDSATPPSMLAVQGGDGGSDVVFSVVNGTVIEPRVPQDIQLGQAVVYPDGFGYEYTTKTDLRERVALFDPTGMRLDSTEIIGTLENRSTDLPTVIGARQETVMTIDGRKLLEIPRSLASSDVRLIGTRLFITGDPDMWQQFDLTTGDAGKTCEGKSLGAYYIGSDGDVVVAHGDGSLAQGIDLTTCERLWSLKPRPDEAGEVWKVHDTLIQRANDRLFSLVAPN